MQRVYECESSADFTSCMLTLCTEELRMCFNQPHIQILIDIWLMKILCEHVKLISCFQYHLIQNTYCVFVVA